MLRFIKRTVKFSYSEFRRLQNIRPPIITEGWLTEIIMERVAEIESERRKIELLRMA
jgi:hypothetical protein